MPVCYSRVLKIAEESIPDRIMDITHMPVPKIVSFYVVRIEMLQAGRQLGVDLLILSYMQVEDALLMAEQIGRASCRERV